MPRTVAHQGDVAVDPTRRAVGAQDTVLDREGLAGLGQSREPRQILSLIVGMREVEHPAGKHLWAGAAQDVALSLVGQQEPPLRAGLRYADGRLGDDAAETLAAVEKLRLVMPLLRDVSVHADPFTHAAVLRRNRTHREQPPLAVGAPQSVLEEEWAPLRHRHLPCIACRLGVIRVDCTGPSGTLVLSQALTGQRRPAGLLADHFPGRVCWSTPLH